MRVISRRALREFWDIHPVAREPLAVWFRLVERTQFANFSALKRTFATADYVAPFTVFNIGGNKYRIVASIHYDRRRVFVRHVFTHAEYDKWSSDLRRGKRGGQ